MLRSPIRDLPAPSDLWIGKNELFKGQPVVLTAAAGRRLAGKLGTVLGPGKTASQAKVLLDGAKGYLLLNVRYVEPLNENPATSQGSSGSSL